MRQKKKVFGAKGIMSGRHKAIARSYSRKSDSSRRLDTCK